MAGEIGHVRLSSYGPAGYGKEGSFEGFCSGGGIAQFAKTEVLKQFQRGNKVSFCESQVEIDQIDARKVAEAAVQKDPVAIEIYRQVGDYLGRGLAILIDVLNPEKIVIGSIYARSGDLMVDRMKEVLHREALSTSLGACQIVPAELGEDIGDVTALAVAMG